MLKRLIIKFSLLLLLFFYTIGESMAEKKENLIYLDLEYGRVTIETRPDIAPNHVKQIKWKECFYRNDIGYRAIKREI